MTRWLPVHLGLPDFTNLFLWWIHVVMQAHVDKHTEQHTHTQTHTHTPLVPVLFLPAHLSLFPTLTSPSIRQHGVSCRGAQRPISTLQLLPPQLLGVTCLPIPPIQTLWLQ